MRTFTYRNSLGSRSTVTADRVVFEPHHVVFKNLDGRIVKGEHQGSVHGLEEINLDDGTCGNAGPPEASSPCILDLNHDDFHRDTVGGEWPR